LRASDAPHERSQRPRELIPARLSHFQFRPVAETRQIGFVILPAAQGHSGAVDDASGTTSAAAECTYDPPPTRAVVEASSGLACANCLRRAGDNEARSLHIAARVPECTLLRGRASECRTHDIPCAAGRNVQVFRMKVLGTTQCGSRNSRVHSLGGGSFSSRTLPIWSSTLKGFSRPGSRRDGPCGRQSEIVRATETNDGGIPWRQIRALQPQPDMDLVGRRVCQARRRDVAMSLTRHLAAGAVHTSG
jgi:hypothetical protein